MLTGPFGRPRSTRSASAAWPVPGYESREGGRGLIEWPEHRYRFAPLGQFQTHAPGPPGGGTRRGSGGAPGRRWCSPPAGRSRCRSQRQRPVVVEDPLEARCLLASVADVQEIDEIQELHESRLRGYAVLLADAPGEVPDQVIFNRQGRPRGQGSRSDCIDTSRAVHEGSSRVVRSCPNLENRCC